MTSWSLSTMRVFCYLFATFITLGLGVARYLHPGKADLPHANLLIKHAIDLLMLNVAAVLVIWPSLIARGHLQLDFHAQDFVEQAKAICLLNALLLPGTLLLLVGSVLVHEAVVPASMIFIGLSYLVLKNGYVYFKGR